MILETKKEDALGFTLVELVATLLVLTFLVLLGLPTLVREKQKTKETSCQSNLRQLGFALQAYAEANDGRLPGPVSLLAAAKYTQTSTNELACYVAEHLGCSAPSGHPILVPQLLCPGRDRGAQGQSINGVRTDYVISDGRGLGGPPFGQSGSPAGCPLTLTAIAAMTTPGNCAAVSDADKGNVNPTLAGWNALPYQPVHGKTRNQLYFDWHVSSKNW